MRRRFSSDDERWEATLRRDPLADGLFLYAVETTGVYCRPVCTSRRPNRRNVLFFPTCEDAESAGFRPCRRCRPDRPDHHTEIVRRACETIGEAEVTPSLSELAATAGLSPSHFHRVFKHVMGITPKQCAVALRRERMQRSLERGAPVTQAIYEAGYGSSSRFYERASETLGMTASEFKGGAPSQRIRFATTETSLGCVLVAVTPRGVCAVELGDSSEELVDRLRDRFREADHIGDDPEIEALVAEVTASIETPAEAMDLPLDIRGTAFQQRIWAALRRIPSGWTMTYTEIAERIGMPGSARAVGRACASNPVAVLIPCHRAVRSDGGLGGYRWGLDRKRRLLEREASVDEDQSE